MAKLALYRKYRPNNFDEIYGQNVIVKTLINAIKFNEISHSYIFAGNKGSGKTTIAKIFSKAINCLNPIDGYNPCNECENCRLINTNATTDFVELDAASNSGVAEVRSIIDAVKYHPTQLKYKIYIIDEAHMLTNSSWNALLKTIEEPPAYVVFIFATTEYHKIPPTIISRCQRYDFNRIPAKALNELILSVCQKEKIKIDQASIDTIIRLSDGAARDALSILDQLINYDRNEINEKNICELFGIIDNQQKIDLINLITKNDADNIFKKINQLASSGINLYTTINEMLEILMDKLIYLRTHDTKLLQTLDLDAIEKIKIYDENKLLKLINVLMEGSNLIKFSNYAKFVFEITIVNAIKVFHDDNSSIVANHDENKLSKKEINKDDDNQAKITSNKLNEKPIINIADNQTSNINSSNNLFTTKDITNEIFEHKDINNTTISNQLEKHDKKTITNKWTSSNNFEPSKKSNDVLEEGEKKQAIEQTNKIKNDVTQSSISFDALSNNTYDDVFENNFFAIANNHNSELKNQYQEIFDSLKSKQFLFDKQFIALFDAEKVLISSNNGMVLLFNNEWQAHRLNQISSNKDFLKFVSNNFKKPLLILGIDKKHAIDYKAKFKKMDKKDFKDVKINNKDEEKRTKLLDILND